MVAFIDDHRDAYGVEPICAQLPIAPSTYRAHKAQQADPSRRSARVQHDEALKREVQRVWDDNFCVYGARKVWRQLTREGIPPARCTVERLMRALGCCGATRGRAFTITTQSAPAPALPADLVRREFTAPRPNALWVADFTYVATWTGFVYTAFVIDVFSRYIVGWRVATTMQASLVLDALEQAVHARPDRAGLIHHSDHGSQYLSLRYAARLTAAGVVPSVGTVGDSYDNALAESVIGLYKTEVIRRQGPWRHVDAVEMATLTWVDWFNRRRLLEPLGHVPPHEYEQAFYTRQGTPAIQAGLN